MVLNYFIYTYLYNNGDTFKTKKKLNCILNSIRCENLGIGKEAVKMMVVGINNNKEVQEMLKNWNKIAAYDLEGEEGIFHVIFNTDGTAEFKEGAIEKVSFTFKCSSKLWAEISSGEKDGQKEFFAKNLKIEGDVMSTMKLTLIGKKLLE